MPEHQSRCEFQRGSVEVGLGAAGEGPGQCRGVRTGLPEPRQLSERTAVPWPSLRLCPWALDAAAAAATPSSLGGQPGRPAEAAGGGEAGCPPGLCVMVIVLIRASRADRRRRRWLHRGCCCGGLGVAEAAGADEGRTARECRPHGGSEVHTWEWLLNGQGHALHARSTHRPHRARGPRREGGHALREGVLGPGPLQGWGRRVLAQELCP